MPVPFDLRHIDQLIEARRALVNRPRGRPPVQNGETLGVAVQRACVVLMSAIIQSFVEDVFLEISKDILRLDRMENLKNYQKTYRRNGNPSTENIENLLLRIGVEKALDGLSWQRCSNEAVRRNLNTLNQLRNDIAHGKNDLSVDGKPYALRQVNVSNFRNFADQFGGRFEAHIRRKLPAR